ncbi:hypothetical protein P3X46_028227 [Hevea brasiliensis]|uniref:non-specific serine/threonine protein kinase n=1 Tax=Hevea brasiliensis TaxID=3981 RepID=A0ABQ9KP73_HEVBR|nr:hypothetical protein P3X46_028227 [Hevea brasiliensis]
MVKWLSFYIDILCWFLYFANPSTCLGNVTDRHALLSFKQAIKRDPFQDLSSWNDSLHYCDWPLILRSRGLVGSLSPHIGNLSFLRVLNFQNNTFHGEIPQEIDRLQRLRYLILSSNSFGGNIQANLSHCSKLVYLDLIDNKLIGNIPTELGSLQKLGALGLGTNNLTKSIPPSIGNRSCLYQISLRANSLQGQIPEELSYLTCTLINYMEESPPHGLYNIYSIEIFNMYLNQLHGRIPSDIGLILPNLSSFVLAYNNFTGSIPVTLSNASGLEQIVLLSNHFTGSIPKDLGMLPYLHHVLLAINQLQDDLSFIDSLTHCSSLEQTTVERNFLNGSIPKSIANLSKDMWILDLQENQLQGTIPLGLENIVNLRFLQLGWNFLSGPVLIDFGKFQQLQYLTFAVSLLGNNHLCGSIADFKLPPCLLPKSNKKKPSSSLMVSISVVGAALFLLLLVGSSIFWHRKRLSGRKTISMPSFNLPFLRISYAELFKARDGFSTSNIIGAGSYSSVYKGVLEPTGTEIAVKVLNLLRGEASHSFISLIYVFMPNGSLDKWLHPGNAWEGGQQIVPENLKVMQRLNIAIDIASAIEYLHNGCPSTIIRGDLQPSNVLLDNEMTARLGDFGLAKIVYAISSGPDQYRSSTSAAIKGTIGYYGVGDTVFKEGDIYSYGILLLEMFTGKKPTDDSFKDGLNLHVYVERSLPYKVMEVVDRRIDLSNDGREGLLNCLVLVMRIGVACAVELPTERVKMVDVIRELQNIKAAFQHGQERMNPH